MYGEKVEQAIREFKSMMSRPIFESVDGIAQLELKKILSKAESQAGAASCDDMAEGRRIRICRTPDGVPDRLALSDGECERTYSGRPKQENDRIRQDTYTVRGKTSRDVDVLFFPEDVTFGELVEYYGQNRSWQKDLAMSASDEVKRDIVKLFAGYVCQLDAFMRVFGGYACKNAYGTVRQKAADAKKKEDAWKHQTLRGIDIDKKFAPITTPDDNDENDLERFREEVDALFNGSAYDEFVPDEYEEVEGAQRDLDDWDVYRINLQSTIDEESFWE